MGTPGVKRPGREADHSPPARAEVKKMWLYTSISPNAFMVKVIPVQAVEALRVARG
jgi:hypothetical protein